MKKFSKLLVTLVACAVFALALALVGCGGSKAPDTNIGTNGPDSISEKAAEANPVDADGILTVGFDQEFPPYGYVGDDGVFTGFDLELAAEVAARNGWDLECVPINWDAKDNELNSGAIDCIWNGFTIEDREDSYAFTDAYMNNSQVVVVKVDSGINTPEDLAGKIVLVQTDSAALGLFEEGGDKEDLAATFAELRQSPDYNNAFMELEQGAVDAVVIDQPVAQFQIAGKEDIYKMFDEPLSIEHFGVGFALGNEAERDVVQATLLDMVADGTAEQIAANYEQVNWDGWCLGK